jgi:hypothetical protein
MQQKIIAEITLGRTIAALKFDMAHTILHRAPVTGICIHFVPTSS